MFFEIEGDVWFCVYFGLYGVWDFVGEILVDFMIVLFNGCMG